MVESVFNICVCFAVMSNFGVKNVDSLLYRNETGDVFTPFSPEQYHHITQIQLNNSPEILVRPSTLSCSLTFGKRERKPSF